MEELKHAVDVAHTATARHTLYLSSLSYTKITLIWFTWQIEQKQNYFTFIYDSEIAISLNIWETKRGLTCWALFTLLWTRGEDDLGQTNWLVLRRLPIFSTAPRRRTTTSLQHCHSRFEFAFQGSLNASFPDCECVGCYFHYYDVMSCWVHKIISSYMLN